MNWFIIRDQDHLGPFTNEDLDELYCSGEINDDTLVWNEDLEAAIPYLQINPNEPPPLPSDFVSNISDNAISDNMEEVSWEVMEDVALENETSETNISNIDNNYANVVRDGEVLKIPFPETDFDETDFAKVDVPEFEPLTKYDEDEDEDEGLEPSERTLNEPKTHSKAKLALLTIAVFIACITPVVIYLVYNSTFSRPAKMSIGDYERLVGMVQNKSEVTKFAFAMAQDRSLIWVATNNPYHGRVAIKLKAIKNKFLGEGEVEAFTFADLNNHLMIIKNFKFNKGVKLIDGYYEVELYTPTRLEKPFMGIRGKHQQQFESFQNVLISTMKPDVFEKSLLKYSSRKNNNESQFWGELKQKYQTLKMITLQIQDGVRTVFLDTPNYQEKINSFENEYKTKYGNFFTNFVLTNEASYESLLNKTFPDKVDIISNYTRLSKLARSIGVQSAKAMDKLRTFKNWKNPKKVGALKTSLIKSFQNIIDVCDYKIGIIQTH